MQITILADFDQAGFLTGRPDTWPAAWARRFQKEKLRANAGTREWVSTSVGQFKRAQAEGAGYADGTHVKIVVTLQ